MSGRPCDQCPWRIANQGKKHANGFYTKANLRRLWNQIRGGGRAQSCHLTDPSHPDHVAAGAKPGATAKECPGSVIIVKRELRHMADERGVIGGGDAIKRYRETRSRRGLTKHGIIYWTLDRIALAGTPIGGDPLPDVDELDPEIGLPPELAP